MPPAAAGRHRRCRSTSSGRHVSYGTAGASRVSSRPQLCFLCDFATMTLRGPPSVLSRRPCFSCTGLSPFSFSLLLHAGQRGVA